MNNMNIVIILYIALCIGAVWFATSNKYDYKYVSSCCKDSYREKWQNQRSKGNEQGFYCLKCKKWCDLIEVRIKE